MKIDWVKVTSYIIIVILSYFLFRSCNNKDILHKSEIDKLNLKIDSLQNRKQEVKAKIVEVQKKTSKTIEKVRPMTTTEIEQYYLKRYGNSQISNDTIAKKNIVELIEKDGCVEELKLTNEALTIEEQKGIFKDTIISNLNDAVILQGQIIKKEKRKKTFWKILSFGLITFFIVK